MAQKVVVKLSQAKLKDSRPPVTPPKIEINIRKLPPKSKGPYTKSLSDPKLPKDSRCRFLDDLPGEIRNKIYALAVGNVYVAEDGFRFWTSGNASGKQLWPVDMPRLVHADLRYACDNGTSTRKAPTKILKYRSGSKYASILSHDARHTSICLVFVCRQVYSEVVGLVYSRATFAFGSLDSIRKRLLGNSPPRVVTYPDLPQSPRGIAPIRATNLPFITSLCLECRAYGSPLATKDRFWQYLYYANWASTCASIITGIPNLTTLRLYIGIPLEPRVRLVLTDIWVQPFLQLSECAALENVHVYLVGSYRHFDSELLEVFAEVIRRKIIGFDDASALEAITHAKEARYVSRTNKCLVRDLKFMERSNGIVALAD